MSEKEEFSIIVREGTQLIGFEWWVENPVGVICLVHGLGEHAGRYDHVAKFFNSRSFSVLVFDQRGHGLSEGKRGHTPSHDQMLDDIEEVLMYARAEYNDLPLYIFGHSMGGNLVLNYLLKKNIAELAGAVVSTPWLKTKIVAPPWQVNVAKLMVRLIPYLSQSNGLKAEWLTYDEKVNLTYKRDPLVHDKISIRLYLDFFDAGLWALKNTDLLKLPVFLYHGADDPIASQEATAQFSNDAGKWATFKLYTDTKHEPHNDLNQKNVLNDIMDWIDSKN